MIIKLSAITKVVIVLFLASGLIDARTEPFSPGHHPVIPHLPIPRHPPIQNAKISVNRGDISIPIYPIDTPSPRIRPPPSPGLTPLPPIHPPHQYAKISVNQ